VFRIYREEELGLRSRQRPSRTPRLRQAPAAPEIPYAHWAADFMADQLRNGTRFRVLNVIDPCSQKALATEASYRFPSCRVTEVLDRLFLKYGKPRILILDNGTEFTSRHFDAWACQHKIQLDFIRPGRPMEKDQSAYYMPSFLFDVHLGKCRRSLYGFLCFVFGTTPVNGAKSISSLSLTRRASSSPSMANRLAV